ncbi:BZ3500_MvSof-1268-A1-R1_Chr10-1g02547 [Microbotryum saponariae]|uniref:BZ3500_MvSof-1268-A1-R1_Chr10-1g02547 protein n=1 Tax=Microbotryum saponariae TaxID=289078 RepID=A0A2X0LXL5_9BASI|nr:BZ3500_MvSof-1268-A1-R1_Chr10-1g02547 [Microbotryum saponariae]SDA06036.1 BZ3501_MvSof-1269-A2-R1_Chr10-1g02148 [Microbotryum saponariae]
MRKGACVNIESTTEEPAFTYAAAETKSNGHFGTCCSRASYLKARIANARSYNNALFFTSLAAHFDRTQVGTAGPPVIRVFNRLYAGVSLKWTAQVAWEMVNEVASREEELALETPGGGCSAPSSELEALELVREAARIKVGVEVGGS